MKTFSYVLAAAGLAASIGLATPTSAQLLGGIVGGGDGDGLLGGVTGEDGLLGDTIGTITDTVVGDSEGNGIVQEVVETVGLGDAVGNGSVVDLDTSGDGQIGVTDVLTAGVSSGGDVDAVVLGGGGDNVGLPLDAVIGGGGGIGVELPGGIGGIIGGGGGGGGGGGTQGPQGPRGIAGLPGVPGISGGGNNGSAGIPGLNGGGRTFVFGGRGGDGGGAFTFNSSRLKLLAKVLQNRAWLRFAVGNKICLPQFGVANVAGWVKPADYAGLQQLLAAYSADIETLQKMLKRCRNGQNRMLDASRVIGVDFKDGQIVVMTM